MRAPEFWYPKKNSTPWQAALLAPLGWLYTFGGKIRAARVKPAKAAVPVICVGNLTAGGVGKTPVVIALLQRFKARGIKAVALTRGYGGKEKGPLFVDPMQHTFREVGDEALLLSAHAPVVVAHDRALGAQLAVEERAQIIVMDDGFQNPSLAKTFSIIVVDAETLFGNKLVMPAGPLREPVADGLKRADAAVLIGNTDVPREFGVLPVLTARIAPAGPTLPLVGRRVFAFAGIGRPEKFFASLSAAGAEVVGRRSFDDHHPFSESEMATLKIDAQRAGATLITTEKDFVRIPTGDRHGVSTFPIHVAFDDEEKLGRIIDAILSSTEPPPLLEKAPT